MEAFVGQIDLFPYNFAPTDWMYCDGALLPIAQYQELFSLIRTVFGGDGVNTFALPNLQGTEPIPFTKYCICVSGFYPPRS